MTVYEAHSIFPLYPAVDQDLNELSSSSELRLWGIADLAIPFEFDKHCYITQMSDPMYPLTSWGYDRVSSTNLRLGTESYVDSIDSQDGARVACRTEGGVLTCGANPAHLPIATTHFCTAVSLRFKVTLCLSHLCQCFADILHMIPVLATDNCIPHSIQRGPRFH